MEYILTRKKGMKNIRIRISGDGKILVSAPYYAAKSDIDRFILEKADWINENISKQVQEKENKRIGDELIFLGEKRKLVFESGNKRDYKLTDDVVYLFTNNYIDEQEKKRLIYSFLSAEGAKLLPSLLNKYLIKSGYNGKPFFVAIKLLKSKWGSCHYKSRRFTFNTLLLKLPMEFIEYTVAHEVTHLYVKGHGKDFYDMGEKIYGNFFATDRRMNKIKNIDIFD